MTSKNLKSKAKEQFIQDLTKEHGSLIALASINRIESNIFNQ